MRRLADKSDPVSRQEKILARQLAGYSRGGELERSHKKMVGNIARRNLSARYDVINKAHNRIETLYKRGIAKNRGMR
jgi:hypothetical protein